MQLTRTLGYRIMRTLAKRILGRGKRLSYAQFGEDAFLQTILREQTGLYIDVGAYDPMLYSNTYALYRRGWKGLAIDPNPDLKSLFSFFRPRDTFIVSGVGDESGALAYHRFSDGAYNTFATAEAGLRKGMKHLRYLGNTPIPVRTLGDIVREKRISRIDFLNVDVEGMDHAVLVSHDWSVPPRVIAVEDIHYDALHPMRGATTQLLVEKGYRLEAHIGHTLIFSRA